jgi:hypothetical protein
VPTARLARESRLDVSDDSVIFCAERTCSITFSGVVAEYIGIHAKHRAYVTSLAPFALPSRYVLVEFTNLWQTPSLGVCLHIVDFKKRRNSSDVALDAHRFRASLLHVITFGALGALRLA